MLIIGSVEFLDSEAETPLVPQVSPRARREAMLEAISTSPESTNYSGTNASFSLRWASGTNHGGIPTSKRNALIALYDTGATFTIQTDMLRDAGNVASYPGCYFEPGSVPVFAPSEAFDFWLFDFVTRIPVATL